MNFRLEPDGRELEFSPEVVIIAGYTGRDQDAVKAHIRELEEQGVRPPPSVPAYFVVPAELLTQADVLETPSPRSSGEAEFALLMDGDAGYVTIASDHTDRAAEQLDVQLSKQACPKVLGRSAWRLDDVVDRWDRLELRGWTGDGPLDLYQEGALAALLPPRRLLELLPWRRRAARFVVLGGTLPAIGGMRVAERFRAEIADPTTGRALSLEYRVEVLEPLELRPARTEPDSPEADHLRLAAASLGVPLAPERADPLAEVLRRVERRLDQ